MERCLFVDFPFFNSYFEHHLDFSWSHHVDHLIARGHNLTAPQNAPKLIISRFNTASGFTELAYMWMFQNISKAYEQHYGVELSRDHDWTAALLESNPEHKVITGSQSSAYDKSELFSGCTAHCRDSVLWQCLL